MVFTRRFKPGRLRVRLQGYVRVVTVRVLTIAARIDVGARISPHTSRTHTHTQAAGCPCVAVTMTRVDVLRIVWQRINRMHED